MSEQDNLKHIAGKKILILGGTTSSMLVVETAKSMGVYTVVTDMNPLSPAKRIADKSYDISTSEIDAIAALIEEEGIDGVFAAYDDQNTLFAALICEKLDLPFYATREQILATRSKTSFKSICKQYGVPTVKEYYGSRIEFPCVVKPSDSYSAKGITICDNESSLQDAIGYALEYSPTSQYLIEQFMDPASTDCVNIEYLIRDGEIRLAAMGDKYVLSQAEKAPITSAVIYPSVYTHEYVDSEIDEKTKSMLKGLGVENGMIYIEGFYDSEGFHFYEMGYRLGGGQSSVLLNELQGIDYVKMLIRYALTASMCTDEEFELVSPFFMKSSCGLVLHAGIGTIDSMRYDFSSIHQVKRTTFFLEEGNGVSERYVGTLGQTLARIHLVCETRGELLEVINSLLKKISVLDADGRNLIIPVDTSQYCPKNFK